MTTPDPATAIYLARQAAQDAKDVHEQAATAFAVRVAQVAALMVRAQFPSADLVVFEKDDNVNGETVIEIISVRDAEGNHLGYLGDVDGVQEQLRIAYDVSTGFFPIANDETYVREQVDYARNLLELHIPTMLEAGKGA